MPWSGELELTRLLIAACTIFSISQRLVYAKDISGCCTRIVISSDGEAIEHQSNRVGEYVLSGVVADRPMYKHVSREEYLFYLMSRNKGLWMVGPKVNQFNGGLAHRGDTLCVEDVLNGEWKYTDGKAWHVDPSLNITCLDTRASEVECTYRDGVQFVGGDLPQQFGGGGIATTSDSSSQCIQECENREGCLYWSWVEREGNNCFLKFDKINSVRVPKYVSGSIPSACISGPALTPDTEKTCSYPEVQFIGSDLETRTVLSFDDCRTRCSKDERCNYFTFYLKEQENCYLMSETAQAAESKDAISGAVNEGCDENSDSFDPEILDLTYNKNEINGKFKMNMTFIEEYNDPDSEEYKKLAGDVENYLLNMIESEPSFAEQADFTVDVVSFVPGSVVCNFKVNYVLKEAYLAIPFAIKPTNITNAMNRNFRLKKGILFQKFIIVAGSFKASSPVDHCSAKGCSHKCDYDYSLEDYLCTCPPSLTLNTDEKTCVEPDQVGIDSSTYEPEIKVSVLPSDCIWSDWSEWASCDCATGKSERKRTIATPAKNGGSCSGRYKEIKDCDCQVNTEDEIFDDGTDEGTEATKSDVPATTPSSEETDVLSEENTTIESATFGDKLIPEGTTITTEGSIITTEGPIMTTASIIDDEGIDTNTETEPIYEDYDGESFGKETTTQREDVGGDEISDVGTTTVGSDEEATAGPSTEITSDDATTQSQTVSDEDVVTEETSTESNDNVDEAKKRMTTTESNTEQFEEDGQIDDVNTTEPQDQSIDATTISNIQPESEGTTTVKSENEIDESKNEILDDDTDDIISTTPSLPEETTQKEMDDEDESSEYATTEQPVETTKEPAKSEADIESGDVNTTETDDSSTEDTSEGTSVTDSSVDNEMNATTMATFEDADNKDIDRMNDADNDDVDEGISSTTSSSTDETTQIVREQTTIDNEVIEEIDEESEMVTDMAESTTETEIETKSPDSDSSIVFPTDKTDDSFITTTRGSVEVSTTQPQQLEDTDDPTKDPNMITDTPRSFPDTDGSNMAEGADSETTPEYSEPSTTLKSIEPSTIMPGDEEETETSVNEVISGVTTESSVLTDSSMETTVTSMAESETEGMEDQVSMETEKETTTMDSMLGESSTFGDNIKDEISTVSPSTKTIVDDESNIEIVTETSIDGEESTTVSTDSPSEKDTSVQEEEAEPDKEPDYNEADVGSDESDSIDELEGTIETTTTEIDNSDDNLDTEEEGKFDDDTDYDTETSKSDVTTTTPSSEPRIVTTTQDPTGSETTQGTMVKVVSVMENESTTTLMLTTSTGDDDTPDTTVAPEEPIDKGEHEFDCEEMNAGELGTNVDEIPMSCTQMDGEHRRRVFLVISKSQVDADTLFAKNVKVVVKDLMVMDISPEEEPRS